LHKKIRIFVYIFFSLEAKHKRGRGKINELVEWEQFVVWLAAEKSTFGPKLMYTTRRACKIDFFPNSRTLIDLREFWQTRDATCTLTQQQCLSFNKRLFCHLQPRYRRNISLALSFSSSLSDQKPNPNLHTIDDTLPLWGSHAFFWSEKLLHSNAVTSIWIAINRSRLYLYLYYWSESISAHCHRHQHKEGKIVSLHPFPLA
jgi:hypothetical protein